MKQAAETWRVWNTDDSVELRTYQRATGELPEMESTKQLVRLVAEVYQPGMTVLDVGCAAGHYYHGLTRIDPNIQYTGVDATVKYIDFARRHFRDNPNTYFDVADIFALTESVGIFDIVYCCNVILHLPDFRVPLKNLLAVTRRHCFIRTLIGSHTCLNKFLYTDDFDERGNPLNFVHQNTYSETLLKTFIASCGAYEVEVLDDEFDAHNINKEYEQFRDKQSAVTKVIDGRQVAGNVIFDWRWLKITCKQ